MWLGLPVLFVLLFLIHLGVLLYSFSFFRSFPFGCSPISFACFSTLLNPQTIPVFFFFFLWYWHGLDLSHHR
uniref:Secreted peptide n=1 Tax=Sus scrofa TaxID=9823 RepID=A0A8D0TR47_PIG